MQLIEDEQALCLAESSANGKARAIALREFLAVERRPASTVSYHSHGSILVIGPRDAAVQALERLPNPDRAFVLVTETPDQAAEPAERNPLGNVATPCVTAQVAAIEGFLGNFTVLVRVGEEAVDLREVAGGARKPFDVLLDLCTPPVLSQEVLPPGYFAPANDPVSLQAAVDEIPSLEGEFEKPQFFVYSADICAHSRSGIQACTRCIDACPTLAITSAGDQGIRVDPYLCQGAGSCASACPSGAIQYAFPRLGDSLERMRRLFHEYRKAGGDQAVLLFHDRDEGRRKLARIADRLPENLLPLDVEEIGSAGIDQWLAAVAYGACRVVLLGTRTTPAKVLNELNEQLSFAAAMLEGMGYPSQALSLITDCTDEELLADLALRDFDIDIEPGSFSALDDKRTIIRLAVDHLHQQAPKPRPLITLPTGAPFGDVWLSESSCTLCMACVSQCPGKALLAGDETPELRFVEDNCVQCGMCARSCPENAIAPAPRYLFDGPARRKVRILKQEQPFLCIRCGKPFATASVIREITHRLQGNPNFKVDDFERLKMCEDCRVKALYETEMAGSAGIRSEVPR